MSSSSLLMLNIILAVMMFGIALSLKAQDFRQVVRQPKGPLVGLVAQFVLLPALTALLVWLFKVPAQVSLGLILVSCCPGGSFSNIVTYLAKGNTAMSVSMTGIASLLATVLTPFNFMFYASLNPSTNALLQAISVEASSMFTIVALVLALPLTLGLLCAKYFPHFATRSEKVFRIGSLLTLLLFVALALGMNWQRFMAGASIFLFAVLVHNALALLLGWFSAYSCGLPKADRRAITLEVGLQNSGLGLGIIFTFFADYTPMAIIAAAWGIWHLISGLGLCAFWNLLDKRQERTLSTHSNNKKYLYES